MAEQKSSFIPQAPVRAEATSTPRSRKVYVLTYVSFVLFFGTVIAAAIIFFLGMQEQKHLNLQRTLLDQEFAQFGESSLAEVRELSMRLSEASDLLGRNVSPVSIMAALELTTVKTVTVTSLTLTKQVDGRYLLELQAKAPHFNATRHQRDLLTGNPVLAGASIVKTTYGTVETSSQDEKDTSNEEVVEFTVSKVLSVEDIPHLVTQRFTQEQDQESTIDELSTFSDDGGSASVLDAVNAANDVLTDDDILGGTVNE